MESFVKRVAPTRALRTSRVPRRLAAVMALIGVGLLPAGEASGAVTIGQIPSGSPPSVPCPAGDYLQPSVTGGTLYIAKQAGRITSWTTYSSGPGVYAFKVFRRTSDPDVFQVIARTENQSLTAGLQTFPTDIAVRSGDMIGFNKQGAASGSCTIAVTGDAVLQAPGDLPNGASGAFLPLPDRRLNLSATLVPSNEFQITHLSRNPRRGTATLVVQVPNPGVFALSGKGLKKPLVTRSLAGAASTTFQLAAGGAAKRKLLRKGAVKIGVTLTFAPTGGDPRVQFVAVKLRMKTPRAAV